MKIFHVTSRFVESMVLMKRWSWGLQNLTYQRSIEMGKFKDLDIDRFSIRDNIEGLYLQWLCEIVRADEQPVEYWELLKHLHSMEFEWDIPTDESRAMDGAKLRTRFREETGSPHREDFSRPCSVLEMMVALAERMEYQLWQMNAPDRTHIWFWEMIANLGLIRFDDEEFHLTNGSQFVTDAMVDVMDRNFDRRGLGSLFPLKRDTQDQRNSDLMYQMMAYLEENYDIV